jgi:hypothetical protein
MRSPFSKRFSRSRMSLMVDSFYQRKPSQSDKSDTHQEQSEELDHCPQCVADKASKTDALMETLYTYLNQDHPESPLYHSPFKIKNSDVEKWAESVAPFVMSPSSQLVLPEHDEEANSTRMSTSAPSSAGSLFSDPSTSSFQESKGPKTPILAHRVELSQPSPLSIADVGLAANLFDMTATNEPNEAVPKIHRAFSFELVPEAPLRSAPPPPDITRSELVVTPVVQTLNTTPCPNSSGTVSECQATITSLIDDFMPEYIPSPQIVPAKKKSSFPILKINTQGFHTPIKPSLQVRLPEIELSSPEISSPHIGEMMSLGYKAYSETRAEQDRRLLSFSERDVSSSRHSIANPIPRHQLNYDEFRKGSTRYSVQAAPSKRLLDDLQEQQLIPTIAPLKYKPYSAPRSPIRQSRVEIELHIPQQQRPVPVPVKYKPYSPPKNPPKRTQAEIEAIPTSASSSAKHEEPVAFATNRGILFTGGFFAREQGLELRMTRMVTTFSKMEWLIQDLSGSRKLKCFAQTNSLSRRKDFWDTDGNLLFNFQKKIGSTRVAEAPCGTEVFSVKNASLPCEFDRSCGADKS